MDTITEVATRPGLAPFSLKDAPALIERVFPAQKVGIEAQKERKAVQGQTLTALGSYWKGRKPLALVRACVLASLLPTTDDLEGDLAIFELLMRMDSEGLRRRKPNVSAAHVWASRAVTFAEKQDHLLVAAPPAPDASEDAAERVRWRPIKPGPHQDARGRRLEKERIGVVRDSLRTKVFDALPFSQQVAISQRVEELEADAQDNALLYDDIWAQVNARVGTTATSLAEFVQQLGIARYGRRPVVGDPFCGGGSIPFESARVGCDVLASDLNPVAAMLTWGCLNVIGASPAALAGVMFGQQTIAENVAEQISALGIESNVNGDLAKTYLYCLETVDPQTGWRVPMLPSRMVSLKRRTTVQLKPDYSRKRFDIVLAAEVDDAELLAAETGTVIDGTLVYRLAAVKGGSVEEYRVPFSRLRGDGDGPAGRHGTAGNRLRMWDKLDISPRPPSWAAEADPVIPNTERGAWQGGDIFQERLYAIQWLAGDDVRAGKARPRSFFAVPDEHDLANEQLVERAVRTNLISWQAVGVLPDLQIEPGDKTDEPIRTRGWTHWHHLFCPRQLHFMALVQEQARLCGQPAAALGTARLADWSTKLCRYGTGAGRESVAQTFYNQALNTLYSYGVRAFSFAKGYLVEPFSNFPLKTSTSVSVHPVTEVKSNADLWIYDPPYADAVNYHEISEFFIAWLRKNAPTLFDSWVWDSKRPLAIQGRGEKFRSDMVEALRTMARNMSDNGMQVCMFTHQDAGVWADMAGIVWGAGLRVTAAWYVSTETTSKILEGGYVQGTVLLVLRKRLENERAYKDELVLEIRGAVQRQVDLLTGLNQRAVALQRDENPFSDADIQMAGYAAAVEVLTGYTHIDGVDMTREALRPRVKGQVGIVEEMIALAVQTATGLMRPDGIDESLWERLMPTERFWLKMTETESNRPAGQPAGKLDDYQNFGKAYRADGWDDLMADSTPNKARLKGAAEFKRAMMTGHPFAGGLVRPVLYAVNELRMSAEKEEDHAASGERAISGLHDNLKSWAQQRQQATVIADWLGRALARHRPAEASAARTLAALIRTERLG